MTEALLYEKLQNTRVVCHICQRKCPIKEGERGYCLTRVNLRGKLYSLIYGRISSIMISPIEKKPVYHFFPSSHWLSLGSFGCNFRCPGCQNWDIAHSDVGEEIEKGRIIPPDEVVHLAKKSHCLGISWTYNEPTLWFEYTLEGAKQAKANNLHTNYVTNGFITEEALDLIGPFLDVFRVDIKGFSEESYRKIAHIDDFTGILEVVKRAKKKWRMHVEIVTNVIPGYNDNEEELRMLASWISTELGKETPWHVTRFFPYLRLSHLSQTPIKKIEKIREIGIKVGLDYVYTGNVWGSEGENTYCPRCKRALILRAGLEVQKVKLKNGKCPSCDLPIAGKFY